MVKSMTHRLDMGEIESCLQHHSRGKLQVSSVSNGLRRPHTTTASLATKRRYPLLFLGLLVVLGLCCWVEFRLGKRSTSIVPSSARVEMDGSFVRKIQRAYDKYHEPICESSSSSSTNKRHCSTGDGATILSLQCQDDGVAPTASTLVQQSLSAYNPTLVCASDAMLSSLQTILEQKYDLVLVESHRQSSDVHDILDFWKTTLLPRGILTLFCCSELVNKKSHWFRTKRALPTAMNLVPWSTPKHEELFLSHVATIYKAKICYPQNKQGLFCLGKILSLDCNHSPGLQLLQGYIPGQGTLYCPKNPKSSSSSSAIATHGFQKQLPLEELFQRRYETIMLDTSKDYPGNLELWGQLLVPGGIITIFGTSIENPTPSDGYLKTLNLEAYYQSSKPPYFLIFVKRHDVKIRDKARVDETTISKKYQPNEGKLNTQIQLSPVSFEDRYPTIYRHVTDECNSSFIIVYRTQYEEGRDSN